MKLFKIKSAIYILTILFSACSYVILSKYFQYETVTNVKPIIHESNLPAMTESVCLHHSENNTDFNIHLTLNNITIKLGPSYKVSAYVCRNILHVPTTGLFGDEIYAIENYQNQYSSRISISKQLTDSHNKMDGRYLFSHYPIGLSVRINIIRLLPLPYDTNCIENDGYFLNRDSFKPICKSVIFFQSIVSYPNINSLVIKPRMSYSSDIMVMESVPALTMIVLIQQVLGLVTLFYDCAIMDIGSGLAVIFSPLYKFVRKKYRKHWIKTLKRYCTKLFMVTIATGLFLHFYFYIEYYMRYGTSSETFNGERKSILVPFMRICPYGNNGSILTVHVALYGYSVGVFKFNDDKCKILSSNITARDPSRDLIMTVIFGKGSISSNFAFDPHVPVHPIQAMSMEKSHIVYQGMIIEERLLQAPYWTDCVDYRTLGLSGSHHCYEMCVKHSSLLDDRNRCKEECHNRPCYSMKPILIKYINTTGHDIQRMNIEDWNQVMDMKTSPQQSWIDFITYSASLLGLWLGLSAMDIPSIFDMIEISIVSLIQSVIRFLPFLFCFIQLYYVIEGYAKYEIVSKVHVGLPNQYILPVISFIQFDYGSNWSLYDLDAISPMEYGQIFPEVYNITTVHVQNPLTRILMEMNVDKQWMKTSIFGSSKISNILLDDMYQYKYIGASRAKESFIRINVDDRFVSDSALVINIRSTVGEYLGNFIIYDTTKQLYVKITKAKLLKHPYSSKCIDYTIDPVTECTMNMHYSEYSKYPNDLEFYSSKNISRMVPDQSIKIRCYNDFMEIRKCVSISYKSMVRMKVSKSNQIDIAVPEQETSCEFSPKSTIYDLIILIGDVIGLWLGISFGLIVNKIYRMSEICCNTRTKEEFLINHTPIYKFDPENENAVQWYKLHRIGPYVRRH